jgi:hypothetical protein
VLSSSNLPEKIIYFVHGPPVSGSGKNPQLFLKKIAVDPGSAITTWAIKINIFTFN